MPDLFLLAKVAPPDQRRISDALDRAYAGVDAEPGLAERILRYVANGLQTVLEMLGRVLTGDGVSGVVTAVAWLIVAALAFVAGRALLRVRLTSDRRVRRREPDDQVDWHARADLAMRAGDHREAVRALYRALVAAMNGRGIVHDEPSLTAGECRRLARRSRPDLASAIDQATGIYERVTYGLGDFGDIELQHMREAERAVLAR